MKLMYIICTLLLLVFIDNACGYTCEQENLFGITVTKSCPEVFDSKDAIYCCGPKENRNCCNTLLGLKEEDLKEIAEFIPTLIGIVISVIIGVIVCCLVCCCCCPFCLLHKRRNRGVIHQPAAPERTNPVPQQPSTQPSYTPVQSAPYPTQPAQYPTQPAPYPTQPAAPYPTQPAGPYPTQPAAPYPTQAAPQGFAAPPMNTSIQMQPFTGDQPPPYSEKQQAYNPNY